MDTSVSKSLTMLRPPVTRQRRRAVSKHIPESSAERNRLLRFVRHYVAEYNPVPPLPLAQLREHAERVLSLSGCASRYSRFIGVLINNEMWKEALAGVPYERRLLLLPKCLRDEEKCPAQFDHFGLLCRNCGLCSIQELQTEAERLGYAVLVAEGSAVVTSLIQTGKIEAIVGVSCLGVLERAFPYMESAAVPGLAIPLLQDDCSDTSVDLEWVWEYIHLTAADQSQRLDLGALRDEVDSWFEGGGLKEIMGEAEGETEGIAREWLMAAGKRWRPFLVVAAYQALRSDPGAPLPLDIRRCAVAVECFHKASLIHDDIEDGDTVRYGEPALHARHGVAVALNAGDLLIGEGYRLIASCAAPDRCKTAMHLAAAEGQRQLCRGQGAELCWARNPAPLGSSEVLAIFRQKTAPAFEVALKLGAIYAAGLNTEQGTIGDLYHEIAPAIEAYSTALGVAYQIRDDLEDFETAGSGNDLLALRPGLILALGHERATGEQLSLMTSVWRRQIPAGLSPDAVAELCRKSGSVDEARLLLETFKERAVRSLASLENPTLKGLLRRVIGKIFNDLQVDGWCKEVLSDEHGAGDVGSRPAGS